MSSSMDRNAVPSVHEMVASFGLVRAGLTQFTRRVEAKRNRRNIPSKSI